MHVLFFIAIGVSCGAIGGLLYFQNKELVVKQHVMPFEFLPKAFDGFTIVQLSDLHNDRFGKEQGRLVDMVRAAKPDAVFITGDLIDEQFCALEPALELVRGLHAVAPIYYVSGNHEWASGQYESLRSQLIELGVHVLENRAETIVRGDRSMVIAGIDDPARYGDEIARGTLFDALGRYDSRAAAILRGIIHRELGAVRHGIDERAFKILLVHRPELLHEYVHQHFSIIFSGHAHGGQWNLPVIGPVVAPGQGLFPKLVSGIHRRHNTFMVISRGLGNSGIAFQRLFNKPEVVVVVLKQSIGK